MRDLSDQKLGATVRSLLVGDVAKLLVALGGAAMLFWQLSAWHTLLTNRIDTTVSLQTEMRTVIERLRDEWQRMDRTNERQDWQLTELSKQVGECRADITELREGHTP